MNKKIVSICTFIVCFIACCSNTNSYTNYEDQALKSMEHRDSLFIAYTTWAYAKANFSTFGSDKLQKGDSIDIKIIVPRIFYDKSKLKLVSWVVFKIDNDTTDCHKGTSYSGLGLIGFRDDTNAIWKLYPLINRQAVCYDSVEAVLNQLRDYYFIKMKHHQMWRIIQSKDKHGTSDLEEYAYNLQDDEFWEKCWIWQKDTVGAYDLYPFQVKSYQNYTNDPCNKCAIPYKLPNVIYPQEILTLYDVKKIR